jgi:hypothetical protein
MRSLCFSLRPLVLAALFAACALSVAAQPKITSTPKITDLPADAKQKAAITRMVSQGIMQPVAGTTFAPRNPTELRQFAVSAQRLFQLPTPSAVPKFADVSPNDPDSAALRSLYPYLQRQAFCPGCSLNNNLHPNSSISQGSAAVAVTSILIARGRFPLVTAAQADQILGSALNLRAVPEPARRYLATAVQNNIIPLASLSPPAAAAAITRGNAATMLDAVQKRFAIPVPQS